jgi:hypothetical protein
MLLLHKIRKLYNTPYKYPIQFLEKLSVFFTLLALVILFCNTFLNLLCFDLIVANINTCTISTSLVSLPQPEYIHGLAYYHIYTSITNRGYAIIGLSGTSLSWYERSGLRAQLALVTFSRFPPEIQEQVFHNVLRGSGLGLRRAGGVVFLTNYFNTGD